MGCPAPRHDLPASPARFRQGELDSLCGAYATVNAVLALVPALDPRALFQAILRQPEAGRLLVEGCGPEDVERMLGLAGAFCIRHGAPIAVDRDVGPAASRDPVIERWRGWLADSGGLIVTNLRHDHPDPGQSFGHWSVLRAVEGGALRMIDSWCMDEVPIARTRLAGQDHDGFRRPYGLRPDQAFRVSRA